MNKRSMASAMHYVVMMARKMHMRKFKCACGECRECLHESPLGLAAIEVVQDMADEADRIANDEIGGEDDV